MERKARPGLLANRFNGASLTDVSFDRVDWGHHTTYSPGVAAAHKFVPVPRNDLSDTVGIDESVALEAAWLSPEIRPSIPASAGEEPTLSAAAPETA
jgi:hypothetical protein